jgi:hypothetical protein
MGKWNADLSVDLKFTPDTLRSRPDVPWFGSVMGMRDTSRPDRPFHFVLHHEFVKAVRVVLAESMKTAGGSTEED